MNAIFSNYNPTTKQKLLVEFLESAGYEFPEFEAIKVVDEPTFNKTVELGILLLEDGYSETISSLNRKLYETRTVGPFEPYPSTPKDQA
jgi:hypothetical protein